MANAALAMAYADGVFDDEDFLYITRPEATERPNAFYTGQDDRQTLQKKLSLAPRLARALRHSTVTD